MRISLVVAHSTNRVIGSDGDMPWRLSNDLRHFKQLTMGHSMVMGRKTFESIGRALPGRQTIVLTRNHDFVHPDVLAVDSWEAAVQGAEQSHEFGNDELFIVGGAQIYALALPHADRIYLTEIQAKIAGDTFFPTIHPEQWSEVAREQHPADEKNDYAHAFLVLDRR